MMNWFSHRYPYSDLHELNLDWIIDHFKEFIDKINTLDEWMAQHKTEYDELLLMYSEIKKDWDNFSNGIWPPTVFEQMQAWWERNAIDLVGEFVRFVFFGLSDDGYFMAYIPENWRDINFSTILEPGDDYGRLCINY